MPETTLKAQTDPTAKTLVRKLRILPFELQEFRGLDGFERAPFDIETLEAQSLTTITLGRGDHHSDSRRAILQPRFGKSSKYKMIRYNWGAASQYHKFQRAHRENENGI